MNDLWTRRKLLRAVAAVAALTAAFLFSQVALAGWWCAPRAGNCHLTKEVCEGLHTGKQCSEYPDVFVLDAKTRRSSAYPPVLRQGSTRWELPLLVQCEAKRKEVERDSWYHSVGKCRSRLAIVAEKLARVAKYTKSIGSCRCATPERVGEMFDVMVAQASRQELIIHRYGEVHPEHTGLDDTLKKELDANDAAMWTAVENGGYWDTLLAMGLSEPLVPPKPETTDPLRDPREEFERAHKLLAKDYIAASSLSDQDMRNLRWATSHGDDPKARSVVDVAVKNMKAVETTVERKEYAEMLVWAEEHLTDPRAKCIVELLDRTRTRTKADLAEMDSLAKRRR